MVGCGNGEGVEYLRKTNDTVDGIDWVDLNNGMMVKDITEELDIEKYDTAICLDVLEHLQPGQESWVLKNLAKCKRQIISVATLPSAWRPRGMELHTNRKPMEAWDKTIGRFFTIEETYERDPGNHKIYFCKPKEIDKYPQLKPIRDAVRDKNVCLIGSVPPDGVDLNRYDVVVRCNDWWFYDGGRCEILFHIGASPKLKVSAYLADIIEQTDIKLLCLYADGAEAGKIIKICGFQNLPTWLYTKQSTELQGLRKYFDIRGGSPSTGLTAAYLLCQTNPKSLHVTGMDLYSNEPNHVGWHRHLPLAHCHWYRKLVYDFDFLTLGPDLMKGIAYWEALNESLDS